MPIADACAALKKRSTAGPILRLKVSSFSGRSAAIRGESCLFDCRRAAFAANRRSERFQKYCTNIASPFKIVNGSFFPARALPGPSFFKSHNGLRPALPAVFRPAFFAAFPFSPDGILNLSKMTVDFISLKLYATKVKRDHLSESGRGLRCVCCSAAFITPIRSARRAALGAHRRRMPDRPIEKGADSVQESGSVLRTGPLL